MNDLEYEQQRLKGSPRTPEGMAIRKMIGKVPSAINHAVGGSPGAPIEQWKIPSYADAFAASQREIAASKVPVIQPGATKTAPAAAVLGYGRAATSANAPSVGAQVASNLLAGNGQQTAPALTGGGGTPERPQDAQQPNVPTLSNQSKMAVAGGAQAGPPAAGQQQAFRSLLGNGLTMTGDMQGNRTYTMGTHGQDGYGRMVVPGGQNAMAAQNLVGARPQAQSPYSFEGSPEDRARFMREPTRPAMQDVNAVSPQRAAFLQQYGNRNNGGAGMEAPKYLGPESGLGWKTRLAKYNAELDAYEKLTGQKTDMDIAAMREAGAGRQSELQAKGVNDANDIARQRLAGDQQGSALDQQAKQLEIQSLQQRREIENRLNATTDPNERRALQAQLLALQGKDSAQKYQIVTREEIDPMTQMPIKTPYAVNQDDPTQSFEIRGQGGQQPDAMGVINGNPAYAKAYSAASPEQQAEMLKKVRERLAQKGGL